VTAFDELILEQSIRRRVGVPGSVVRIDRDSRLPLAAFRAVAESAGGGPFQLVAISDGVPGHFSLRGGRIRTVVFHQRQVEVCAHLYGLSTEQRFDPDLLGTVFEGAMLRLVAEFLLQGGHGDQALSTLAKSRRVQGGIVLQRPTGEQLAGLDRDERYLVEWFYALGHEIGHDPAPDVAELLGGLDAVAPDTIAEVVDAILDLRFDTDAATVLREIVRCGDGTSHPLSHASPAVLRREAIADLFGLICMAEAWEVFCAAPAGRPYGPERLLFESVLSMSSVMAIEQCRIMADWFADMSGELENQPLMLAGVALQVRMNLLAFSLRDPDVVQRLAGRFPAMARFGQFDQAVFANGMRFLQARTAELGAPFERARHFLASPEMRDPTLLQDYFEQVATDRVTAFDATEFLELARYLDSPMIAALRSVVAGEPPPLVTTTR
jgi:hypothetical protein